jgi:hypothetical protein
MLPPPLQLDITVTASLCIAAAYCHQTTNFPNGPLIKGHIFSLTNVWVNFYQNALTDTIDD